jgi:signal transduction histidine kinase
MDETISINSEIVQVLREIQKDLHTIASSMQVTQLDGEKLASAIAQSFHQQIAEIISRKSTT